MKKLLLLSMILVASLSLTAQYIDDIGDGWDDTPMDTVMIFGNFPPDVVDVIDAQGYSYSFNLISCDDRGLSDEQLMTVLLSMDSRIDYIGSWWSYDGVDICYNDQIYENNYLYHRYNRHHPYWRRGEKPVYGGLIFFMKTN
jgi:hypothetical protein